jgi:class 3 adenylate cyclase
MAPSSNQAALIGREPELARLKKSFNATVEGSGQLVFLLGEPGVGKTYLAEVFSRQVSAQGASVLWGRCGERGAPPYWPFIEVIREAISDGEASGLPPASRLWLERVAGVFPEFRPQAEAHGVRTISPSPRRRPAAEISETPEAMRFNLFDSVSGFLKDLSRRRPLLIVVDDLQGADLDSLQLLTFVAHDFTRSRIALLITCQDGWFDLPAENSSTLASLIREADQIKLQGFSERQIAQFIRSHTNVVPDRTLVSSLYGRTAGNPLFLDGLAGLMIETSKKPRSESDNPPIPDSTVAMVQHRLRPLSETAQRVLQIAAAVEGEFDLDILARVSNIPRDEIASALAEANRLRLVVEYGTSRSRYRFFHGLVAEALRARIGNRDLAKLHNEIGQAFESATDQADGHLARLAYHFSEALPFAAAAKAVDYTRRAASLAQAQAAYGEAARLYQLGLRCTRTGELEEDAKTRCELLLALGEVQKKDGARSEAEKSFDEAASIAHRQQNPQLVARAAIGSATVSYVLGFANPDSIANLEKSLTTLPNGDGELRALLMAQLAIELFWSNDRERAIALSRQAVDLARQCGNPLSLVWALWNLHRVLWGPENLADRLTTATEIVHLAEQIDEWDAAIAARHFRMAALIELGRIDELDDEIETCSRLAKKTALATITVSRIRTMKDILRGDFEDAERELRELQQVAHRRADAELQLTFAGQFGQLRGEQGRLLELEPLLKKAARSSPGLVATRSGLALLYARSRREMDARIEFEYLAADNFSRIRKDWNWLGTIAIVSEVCATLGDTVRGETLYALLTPYAGSLATLGWGDVCYGPVAHYLGLLAGSLRRFESAQRHFEESIQLSLRNSARPILARTQVCYAEMLVSRGDTSDAERSGKLLNSAREIAEHLGMSDLINRIDLTIGILPGGKSSDGVLPQRESRRLLKTGGGSFLATLLFVDIVSSTERIIEMGNRQWAEKLTEYYALIRKELDIFDGRELGTSGDGFFATFDSPARAVRCAEAVRDSALKAKLGIRFGIHTGECEAVGDNFTGVAVHIAARLVNLAAPEEILVSSTVHDLLAGSDIRFRDRGLHSLKGVPEPWRVFVAER